MALIKQKISKQIQIVEISYSTNCFSGHSITKLYITAKTEKNEYMHFYYNPDKLNFAVNDILDITANIERLDVEIEYNLPIDYRKVKNVKILNIIDFNTYRSNVNQIPIFCNNIQL
jgi:hypothetical protein